MMRPIPIYLAVEDVLSEWVARRILRERPIAYAIGPVFGHRGFGYLKKNIRSFSNAAKGCPILLLTDLDKYSCPPDLVREWTPHPLHHNLLFRVAVREVESWLLGDVNGLAAFLRVKGPLSVPNPESLTNPKEELLRYALKCPKRQIRDALVWRDDKSGKIYQGPDYNATLARFVSDQWNISSACSQCRSLVKLFSALKRLENRI